MLPGKSDLPKLAVDCGGNVDFIAQLPDGMRMDNIGNLTQLEVVVDRLLNGVTGIKQENLLLKASLDTREHEILNLKQQLQMLQGERSQIEQRITVLLNSIDKWEKLIETPVESVKPTAGVAEKTLF